MNNECLSTDDFQEFVDTTLPDRNYNDIYDLYQTVSGAEECGKFMMQQADNGLYVIIHETIQMALVITKQELPKFLEWLTANLMDGLDADDFWSMNDGMKAD